MSAALRIAERLATADDCPETVIVFAAALLAPLYGRIVTIRLDGSGEPVPVSCARV